MKSMIAVVLTSLLLGACARSAEDDVVRTSAEAVSAAAPQRAADPAEAKARLALAEVAEVLGGGKPADAYQLDEGFSLRYLDRAALRSYDGKASLDTLAPEVRDRVYPVLEGGSVVASLTLHETDGVWATRAIGVGAASGKLSDLRRQLRATTAADGDAFAIVHVNGMNERFIVHQEHGVEHATSVKAGTPTPREAQAVLGELSARALREATR
jgi:hypothetical protein